MARRNENASLSGDRGRNGAVEPDAKQQAFCLAVAVVAMRVYAGSKADMLPADLVSRALASMNINLDKADLQEQIAAADKYWYSVVRDSNDVTSLGKLLSERWQDPALWQDAARERGARPCAAPPTAKHPDDYKPQCH
jgi:hypothetical protein